MSDAQQKIRELHQEIIDAGKKKKDLNLVIRDAHANFKEYSSIMDEMKALREKKKQLDAQIREQFSSEFSSLEDIKTDMKDTKIVLSDLIWNELIKNNPVEIVDEWDNHYIPQVLVTLKKDR